MGWIATTTGPLLNLDKVHYLDVEGSGSSWSIVAYMDTGVVISDSDSTTTTLTYATYTAQADAIAALGALLSAGAGRWFAVAGGPVDGGGFVNLDKVYQFVTTAGNDGGYYVVACLEAGTTTNTGNDISLNPTVGSAYDTEDDAAAALAALAQQLAIVGG